MVYQRIPWDGFIDQLNYKKISETNNRKLHTNEPSNMKNQKHEKINFLSVNYHIFKFLFY